MQADTIFNCFNTSSEIRKVGIKVLDIAQTVTSLLKGMRIFTKTFLACIKSILPIMWIIWVTIGHNHLHKT
uniref:Uncharacterized protein n=1 Tax=Rhizophora mucronata TaxID=61149 RepID=A0A2P2QF54_RHIMU